mgnify:CR=1 FL=1
MSVQNHGSQYLTKDNQSHMYIEFHRGFEKICQRIRAKYPDLTIQACASGGGRANYGVLPYFDEFWVSDNTDACNVSICSGELPISSPPSLWHRISVLPPIIRRSAPSL